MSEENVEIIRRTWHAFSGGFARGDLGAWFDCEEVSDDLEWVTIPGVGLEPSYRGREGFLEFMRLWTSDFQDWSIELKQLIDAGEDRVVSIYRQKAIGVGSGVPVELEQGAVHELEGGRVVRVRHFASPKEALEAAGLSE